MTPLRSSLRRLPWAMIAMVLLLCLIGQMSMDPKLGRTQLVWMVVSLGVMALAAAVPYRRLGEWSGAIFAFSLALLLAVLVLPPSICPPINGSRRWISLPGALVQPSEIAKIAYILMLAWYLRFRSSYRTLAGLLVPFALTLVPLALVLKEPDLGTSMLFLPTLLAMLFLAGAKGRHLLAVIGLGALLVIAVVFLQIYLPAYNPSFKKFAPLGDYQEGRIRVWLNQGSYANADERDKGYQIRESLMAVGSGQLAGQRGPDAIYTRPDDRNLPERDTDFIFALIGHQWGFIGCTIVLVAYLVIFASGVDIAGSTADPFGRLLAVGVVALFAAQMAINVGVAIGLLPVTGMTLPFVSYGGSSLAVNFAALGLLVNIHRHRPIVLYRRRFEWRDDIEALT